MKIIALITRKEGVEREEFLRIWHQDHPPYIRALPGIRRYRQNPAIEHHKPWPFDGAAELWFDSLKDIAAAFASPAGDAMREHEEEFIGNLQWFIADELEIDLSGVGA